MSAPTVDQLRELIAEKVNATLNRVPRIGNIEEWKAAVDRRTVAQVALDDALGALSEELDRLRLDAGRMDWLEANCCYPNVVYRTIADMSDTSVESRMHPKSLRAKIDAARLVSAGAPRESR